MYLTLSALNIFSLFHLFLYVYETIHARDKKTLNIHRISSAFHSEALQ